MKYIITMVMLGAVLNNGLNAEAMDQQKTITSQQVKEAKQIPVIRSHDTGIALNGYFDEEGLALWYIDGEEFIMDGTHLKFDLSQDIYGTMFANKTDLDLGRVYNRYFELSGETLYFPLSWKGRQYLFLEGYPNESYSVPFNVSRYEPIDVYKSAIVHKQTSVSLLVKMKEGATRSNSLGARSVKSLVPEMQIEKWTYHSIAEAKSAKQKLDQSGTTYYTEYDTSIQALGKDAIYHHQWSLLNAGQKKGLKGADIGFTAMQNRIQDKKQTKTLVAVIDSGINPSYADFAGKVRMDLGYDFVNHSKVAWDDNGHGSHVAGIIAAGNDNTYGMTGISESASIIPIKILDADGLGQTSDLVSGIRHAVKKGAKIINLSLGGGSVSQSVESALAYAKSKNVLIVAASGNDGEKTVGYPARSKYVLSVGATGRTDRRADFSNYGKGLDLVAPGVSIPSYLQDGELAFESGTSMATPHVAGVASVLYSLKPSIKPSEVESILKKSAKDLGTKGYDSVYGFGRLDANQAVRYIK